jgi:hypothetical protein
VNEEAAPTPLADIHQNRCFLAALQDVSREVEGIVGGHRNEGAGCKE